MGPNSTEAASASRLLVIVLIAVLGTIGTLVAVSRNTRLAQMLQDSDLQYARLTKRQFEQRGYYQNRNTQAIYEEMAAMDCSHGGVYLIGSSVVACGTDLWNYGDTINRLVHNFGFKSTTHRFQRQIVEYLVSRPGFLEAGADKSLFILGVGYTSCSVYEPRVFPSDLASLGGYAYDEVHGISKVDQLPWELDYLSLRVKVAGFIESAWRCSVRGLASCIGNPVPRKHNAKYYNVYRQVAMSPDWKQRMENQIGEIGPLIRFLRNQQIPFEIVLLPLASWEQSVPYSQAYAVGLNEVCKSENVHLRDLSNLLDDEDFADGTHYNLDGVEKLTTSLLEIAIPFLKTTGALSEERPH